MHVYVQNFWVHDLYLLVYHGKMYNFKQMIAVLQLSNTELLPLTADIPWKVRHPTQPDTPAVVGSEILSFSCYRVSQS